MTTPNRSSGRSPRHNRGSRLPLTPETEPTRPLNVTIDVESFDSPDAKRLIAALDDQLATRYAPSQMFGRNLKPEHLVDGQGLFLVARVDGRATGCGAVRRLDESTAEIKRMYVEPAFRGKGIARLILEQLESAARNLGVRRLVLETGVHQHEAIRLYRRDGFTVLPCWGGYAGSATSLCFEKLMDPQ